MNYSLKIQAKIGAILFFIAIAIIVYGFTKISMDPYDFIRSPIIRVMIPSSVFIGVIGLCLFNRYRKSPSFPKYRTDTLSKMDENQIIDMIKNELSRAKPSKKVILKQLYNLKINSSLSDNEFFDIVGEVFQLNPKFFKIALYSELRNNLIKIFGNEGIKMMDTYILEKYCFNNGEKIIYYFDATIMQEIPKNYSLKVRSGYILVTTHRIIAHGKLKIIPYESVGRILLDIGPNVSIKKARNIYSSCSEDSYGYPFPIIDLLNLRGSRDGKKINYKVNSDELFARKKKCPCKVEIRLKEGEQGRQLLETLKSFSHSGPDSNVMS